MGPAFLALTLLAAVAVLLCGLWTARAGWFGRVLLLERAPAEQAFPTATWHSATEGGPYPPGRPYLQGRNLIRAGGQAVACLPREQRPGRCWSGGLWRWPASTRSGSGWWPPTPPWRARCTSPPGSCTTSSRAGGAGRGCTCGHPHVAAQGREVELMAEDDAQDDAWGEVRMGGWKAMHRNLAADAERPAVVHGQLAPAGGVQVRLGELTPDATALLERLVDQVDDVVALAGATRPGTLTCRAASMTWAFPTRARTSRQLVIVARLIADQLDPGGWVVTADDYP